LFGRFRKPAEEQAEDQAKLQASLSKTRQGFFGRIGTLFQENEVTEATYDELEELLIQSDVGINTALEVVEKLKARVKRDNLKRVQDVRQALNEELASLLAHPEPLTIDEPRLLTVVLIVGVNGSGKTTSIAKLAQYYKRRGKKVVLAAADTFRAAAIDQLKIWGERTGVEVIAQVPGADPGAVVFDAIRASQESRQGDLLIVDTAGRLHIDEDLMTELQELKQQLEPTEILFVADAMTGQDAVKSAEEFHKRLGITGVILTKMDGDARGGAALSIRYVTGQALKFVGVGEKFDALEPFHPDRAASRILGMGDVLSFIEKVGEAVEQKSAEELQQKILDNDFTLQDFRDQMRQLRKLGSLQSIISMLPGIGPLKNLKDVNVDEAQIARVVAIIDSMTLKERFNHMLINGSRRRRIARGSGTTVQEINQLLKQFAQARKMMKSLSGGFMGKRLGKMMLPGM